ncbi:MAG TPA: PIN domain-containing protein [archaeon]|nr:PIN domain-containing protein [archaeon]
MKDDYFFIDTNVLVYAFDESEKAKREKAKKIVEKITKGEMKGAVSGQVLGELFTVLLKKIEKPVEKEKARIIVNGLIDSVHWKKINYSEKTISNAMDRAINDKTPFWDSLIAETMIENKVPVILTENLKDFKSKELRAVNPFK